MVNVHEKYPDGAVNKAAYSTDGSNVRDATEEEKVRYRNANKHRRKKVDEKSSSSEPSASNTVFLEGATAPARYASARAERSTDNVSSGGPSGGNPRKDKSRDKSRNKSNNEKGDDRGGARAQETRDSSRNRTTTTLGGGPDEEKADRREMEEILGRIEARRVTRNLELARATIKELKSSMTSAPVVPPKTSRKATQRSKGKGEKETGITRGANKTLANPVTRELVDSRGDDAISTLKFVAIEETGARPIAATDDMASIEMGISMLAMSSCPAPSWRARWARKCWARKSSDRTSTGVSDCYVELATARKKSRTTVSVAPPNSIDSDDLKQAEISSELPLSHSDVHIGLSGDAVETATGARYVSGPTEIGLSDRQAVQESTRPCSVESGLRSDLTVGSRAVAQVGGADSTAVLTTVVTEVAAN